MTPLAASPLWWAGLVLLGGGVGFIAGMFGVGGGFLLTPLLAILFRVPLPVAVGTGLCQMIGVATSTLLRHQRLGQGEIKIDWIMLAGSLVGVRLGASAVTSLDSLGSWHGGGHTVSWAKIALSVGYITVLGAIALWMRRDVRRPSLPPGINPPPGPLTRLRLPPMTTLPRTGHTISAPLVAYLGLVMGFLSGLLGIGGGVALLPLLLYGVGMRVRMAAGTGVLVLLATSLMGTYSHALAGHVRLDIALALLAGSGVGAQIGAAQSARVDGQRLRQVFVYLIVLTAGAVAWDLLRAFFSAAPGG